MKVCTDACLFGAWIADKIEKREIDPKNILDIGSGTGLLSLMLAQKSNAQIDSVEIDKAAFIQSTENVQESPWKNNVNIHHISAVDFTPAAKYDLIISNPPFYENQLRSGDEKRNTAMHDTSLSFTELSQIIKNHLAENGIAAILLPYDRVNAFEIELQKQHLFIKEKMNVSHSPAHPYFRSMLIISSKETVLKQNTITIKGSTGRYSQIFKDLLKDFYLAL